MTPEVHENTGLLRLLQLVSPSLPVGAYSYSQGLESAVEINWVTNEKTANEWICGLLTESFVYLDVPLIIRFYKAWKCQNLKAVDYWNHFLYASRETMELQQEDVAMGHALARLLKELTVKYAAEYVVKEKVSFASMFALASSRWGIDLGSCLQGFCWSWCENQVVAAIKIVPLGQTAGQRILVNLSQKIPDAIEAGKRLDDFSIGRQTPSLCFASSWHETQYSRMFRS